MVNDVTVRKQLKAARDAQEHVSVRTRTSRVDGFVAAVGKRWCAVVAADDAQYGGLVLLPVADVRSVHPRGEEIAKRFLQHASLWPPSVPQLVDLSSTGLLLFTAGSLSRTLGITVGGTRLVATVERVGRRRLTCRTVSPKGRWRAGTRRVRLSRISQVTLWEPAVATITAIADDA